MDMNFVVISAGLKNGWEAFKNNIVAYVVGCLIAFIGSILIVTFAPLMYGIYHMAVKGSRGEKVEIGDVLIGFKSVNAFIRSWIYWIVYLIALIIIGIITFLLTKIASVLSIIGTLLGLIWALIAFFSIYIYVMSPSKNAIDTYKEGFNVLKNNLLMTLVTYVVYCILCFIGLILCGIGILITFPIAIVFTATVLKALKPGI
ncbi:MAG: hypothetical protein FWE78_02990 [Methanimicrococcus sp.]|nr:hypothetical protein [Methanimicrococcus sp.]